MLLRGVLAPAAQKLIGIQQNIETFTEETIDQLRVATLADIALTRRLGRGQTFLVQGLNPCQKLRSAFDCGQWQAFQLRQALTE